MMAERVYAVSCGEALHMIPADTHDLTEENTLVVRGREKHSYGPEDWDMFVWADSRQALLDALERIKLAPRLSE